MAAAVKICGLTRLEDVAAAVGAGADLVGAILVATSRRSVAPDALASLFAAAKDRAKRVAVTVDPADDLLDRLAASGSIDLVQLHGDESVERVAAIRQRTGLGVIKALPVAVADDLRDAAGYAAVADLLLFDAKPPPGAPAGGNGLAFEWHLVRAIDAGPTPWGLAGGLDPTNVQQAVRLTGAGFVDVASGVETAPGRKDHDLVRAFVAAAKRPPDGGKE